MMGVESTTTTKYNQIYIRMLPIYMRIFHALYILKKIKKLGPQNLEAQLFRAVCTFPRTALFKIYVVNHYFQIGQE